ncbi:hypothetical protein COLO4_06009 [Corchorus olitorius]|uniref:Uncharacterized protein n=1 Tax=Corchorus olitorius TaxID=93759 RepID=A0A1R3KP85_9ROSI|nr:hypothetical protein COLO4_06009 [Corchorus olitorius]
MGNGGEKILAKGNDTSQRKGVRRHKGNLEEGKLVGLLRWTAEENIADMAWWVLKVSWSLFVVNQRLPTF